MLLLNSVRTAPWVRSAVAVAVLSMTAGGALAQAESKTPLEPVVVTASRAEMPLQHAPVGATVITAEDMRRAGVRDANEAIRRLGGVPGRTDLFGGRDNSLSLRGFGATADLNQVVLINGIRTNEAQMVSPRLTAIPVDQIERIEIVRGGQSVQWGAGASAGVINVILKDERAQGWHGRVAASVESFDGHEVSGNVSHGGKDWWIDADVKRLSTDGYRDNGDYRQDVGGIQGSVKLGAFTLHGRLQQEHQTSGLPGALSFAQFSADPRQTLTPDDWGQTDETNRAAGVQWAQGATVVKFDAASRERASRFYQYGSERFWRSHTDQATATAEHTVRWAQHFSLQGVVGLDWQHWTLANAGYGQDSEQTTRAWFGQLNLSLPSKTRVSVGARHEHAGNVTAYSGFTSYDRNDTLKAWDVGVSQTLLPSIDVYARTARSYRLPTADEYGFAVMSQPLRPQINRDWEAGIKWLQDGQSATLRVFRQNTRDEIDYDPINGANANLAPLRRQGVEVDTRWAWVNGWSTQLTAQALTARFTDGPLDGKQVPLVANRSLTWRVGYQFNEQHRVDGGAQYLSSIRFNNDVYNNCARRIPSSTLLDARYQWTDKLWTASVGVTNLADRDTYNMAYSCTSGSLYPDTGRAWRATVSRRF